MRTHYIKVFRHFSNSNKFNKTNKLNALARAAWSLLPNNAKNQKQVSFINEKCCKHGAESIRLKGARTMSDQLIDMAKQKIDLLLYIERATATKAKRRRDYYVVNPCPFCGKKNHFLIRPDQQYYRTFAGCGRSGTIIDFLMEYENLSQHEAIKKTLELAGMDSLSMVDDPKRFSESKQIHLITASPTQGMTTTLNQIDFTELVEIAHRDVGKTNYFRDRGLTDKTIRAYKLGYSATGLNFAQKYYSQIQGKTSFLELYKFVLPIWGTDGKCHYFISRLDESSVPPYYKEMPVKTYNLPGMPVSIFNLRYLESCNSKIIFITEGIFDALSVEEFDYPCIALNGTSNAKMFFEHLMLHLDVHDNTKFVLVPDNDDAGQKLKQKFQEKFHELGVPLYTMEVPRQYKDANEYLIANRKEFERMVNQTVNGIQQEMKQNNERFVAEYLKSFFTEVMESGVRPISTGFAELDEKLSGGLIPGLYVLGAISSLGKTTFIHQMADTIAGQQIPVLFFSLEMSKKEMVSKSISRQSYILDGKNAYTAIDILKGNVPKQTLEGVINAYYQKGNFLKIEEGSIQTDVHQIREQVQKFKEQFDRFVVFVDYLQILQAPSRANMGDKQTVEYNVSQLKLISRDFDVPVIVVSSFNRSNYNQTVGFESFKESGIIEYSADVVMALQLKNMGQLAQQKDETTRRDAIHEAKAKPIRSIELVILKQRNGIAWARVDFAYHAKFNFFRCVAE
ncbi:DnaB-like helicase C-terminal domain-containing protein [Cohnella thermotolerans]|uniref:DnaB-like helicase C-terminal domain-containing protein n=1 Tax=Cohnella thermotolerans TaxID=329858 RepID=UPI0012EC5D46|nr:DnaB-like helicase C-terminal domain-containing protein [Cohnella thermotolerans]